jgi:phosphoribosylformylglycinamidine (FGAM) synthase-like amidotransferase family enzyme
MRAAVLVFPGSNCDRDLAVALSAAGAEVSMVWHKETALPKGLDLVAIPGGLLLRRLPALRGDRRTLADLPRDGAVRRGRRACAGHLQRLPGAAGDRASAGRADAQRQSEVHLPHRGACRADRRQPVHLGYAAGQTIAIPVAHHDGNYQADAGTLDRLEGEGRVAFTYTENRNGSARDIAGILSENRRVLGMMPHPERAADPAQGGTDGAALFSALVGAVAPA